MENYKLYLILKIIMKIMDKLIKMTWILISLSRAKKV